MNMNNITLAEKMIVLSGALLFALMIAVNSFFVNDNPDFRVPMTTYLIVMIALFFLDTIISIFIQMQYASDPVSFIPVNPEHGVSERSHLFHRNDYRHSAS